MRTIGFGSLERTIVVILGLKNRGKERVLVSDNIPSSVGQKAFIDRVEVPNAQTSVILCLANVFLGTESYRGHRVVFIYFCLPESPDDGIDFLDKRFRKKNSGHVVDMNER